MDRREIRLQALNKGVTPVIHMVQGDTGRVLRMYPEDMSAASFQSAVLAVHRPDDSYYSITCDFDDKDYFDADMTQALTRPGRVACQLKVSYSADMVSTYTFYVIVEPSTDGLPVEQLGYDIYDLIDAAQQIQNVGLTEEIKQALLDCFEHVAWTDEHGQDYVDALEAALYPPAPPATLVSISAVYTQSGTVYNTDTLDSLKSDLVVSALYDDQTTATVTAYTLSGTLTVGTSTITVTYNGKTTTFTVTVTSYELVDYSPTWLTRDTSATVPTWTIAASDVTTAANGFPDYLAVVICNQTTSFPSGYRASSVAQYTSRTSGWTTHTYAWDSSLVSHITEVVVDGKSYAYITFTKAQSDAAYALWEAAIANNEISTGGKIQLLNSAKTYNEGMDVWMLNVNVTSENIDDIVSRLPSHSS